MSLWLQKAKVCTSHGGSQLPSSFEQAGTFSLPQYSGGVFLLSQLYQLLSMLQQSASRLEEFPQPQPLASSLELQELQEPNQNNRTCISNLTSKCTKTI